MELIPLKISEEHDALSEAITGGVLSENEKALLYSLISEETISIDVLLNKDSTDQELDEALNVCMKSHGKLYKANMRLKPVIGRLLCLISEHPEIYKSRGYKSFDKFMSEYIPKETGMTRSEAYNCRRIMESFPSLTVKDFEETGYVNLTLLCRVTKDSEPSRDTWMEKAKEMTVEGLKEELVKEGIFDKDDLERAKIEIKTTKSIADNFKEFVNDKSIQGYCGTNDPGVILDLMMAEVGIQWRVQGNSEINQ